MSTRRETFPLIAGSLNWIAQPDAAREIDALVLANWRIDQYGYLKSRAGMALAPQTTAGVHTIARVEQAATRRYYGAGASLYRNGSSILGGLDGARVGIASTAGYAWIMNRNAQMRDNGTDAAAIPWGVAVPAGAPTATPLDPEEGETGYLQGDLQYYVTFVEAATGYESAPLAFPSTVTVAAQKVLIESLPVLAGHHRNLYRIGGALEDAYLVYSLNDDSTTSVVDNYGDESAIDDGIVMDPDVGAPPAARGVAGPYLGRLIAWSTATNPNRMFWSEPDQPNNFRESSWADAGELGDDILRCIVRSRLVMVYSRRSIWRMTGDPGEDNRHLERVSGKAGLLGENALAEGDNEDYFQQQDGLYACNTESVRKISQAIEPIFRGEFIEYGEVLIHPLNDGAREKNVMEFRGGRLYFSYCSGGATSPDKTLVGEPGGEGGWRWHMDSRGFTALYDEGPRAELLGANATGVYSMETGYADAGAAIECFYLSQFHHQGQPQSDKTYVDLVIEHNTGGASLTVKVLLDYGAQEFALGSITSSEPTRTVFPLPLDADGEPPKARNLALQIDGTLSTAAAAVIYKASINAYLEARPTRLFDSDEVDFGDPNPKELYEIEVDYDAPAAAVTLEVYTDLPGGVAAVRATFTLGPTAGRVAEHVPLVTPHAEGRQLRITIESDADFMLYGLRVKHRSIGTYIDGANGEVWSSEVFGID
jgi:hypothetical protein